MVSNFYSAFYLILLQYIIIINLEWTSTLLKFTKEQLTKLQDYYQNTNLSMSSSHYLSMSEEQKVSLKQWNYCTTLIKYMYQVNYIHILFL